VTSLLIPGQSPYRPVPVAFVQIAVWAAAFTTLSYCARSRMGVRLWRGQYSLSVVVFALATVHGLFSGSDSGQDAVWWVYLTAGLLVLFLLVYRVSSPGSRSTVPTRAGL
jgi:DMSO/TMAO reductase YedYZ heme-binding membrane subunit